jgi:ATP-binding cassette subfamily B protein
MAVLLRFGFRSDPRLFLAYFAAVSTWQIASLGGVYATKVLVDAALRGDLRAVTLAGAAFGLSVAVGNLCARANLALSIQIEEKAGHVLDAHLMAVIGGLPGLEHHEHPRYQDEVSLVRSQRHLLTGMTHAVVQNFRYWLQLAGAAALLVRIDPLLLLLPLFGLGSFLTGRKAQEWEVRAQEATAERRRLRSHLFTLAATAAAGKELRIFDTAGAIVDRYDELTQEVEREVNRSAWQRSLLGILGSLCFAAGYAGAIALVLARAVAGLATPGDVVLTVSLASQMTNTVGSIVGMGHYLRSAIKAAARYLWLVDYAANSRPVVPDPAPVPARLVRGITLEGVSFRYPDTEGSVLEDVNLHLPAGSVVALVGENGAGKTTLVKLLCRFYEPSAPPDSTQPPGRILLDGTDLRRFDVTAWRRRLGTGFQDFSRFEFTLRDTVGVGDLARRADVPALEHALARAGAGGMAGTLPHGWDTQLGKAWPGGIDLSGGQWQKLALARALLRWGPFGHPLLVIFDEPTAALDAPTEYALFERLAAAARTGRGELGAGSAREPSAGTVTLVVSHRFSTVRMADLIVVLDQGRVREAGSHAELMRRGGLYAELYTLQARAYR